MAGAAPESVGAAVAACGSGGSTGASADHALPGPLHNNATARRLEIPILTPIAHRGCHSMSDTALESRLGILDRSIIPVPCYGVIKSGLTRR
jgi:hypothetical protein